MRNTNFTQGRNAHDILGDSIGAKVNREESERQS